jgi:hypothetical protein
MNRISSSATTIDDRVAGFATGRTPACAVGSYPT